MVKKQYPTTDYIEELIEKYTPPFSKDKKNGLFILPAQTGSGKTHAVAKTIIKILKEYKNTKVFYIIKNKSNRDDLYQALLDENPSEELKSEIFSLQSNIDHYIDFFKNNSGFVFKIFGDTQQFKTFKTKIDTCISIKKSNPAISNDELSKIVESAEKDLKSMIKNHFNIYMGEKQQKKDHVDHQLEKEISALYPMFNLQKRVVISTTKKFLTRSFDLPRSSSLADKMDGNTILVIDEFDEQKRVMLEHFIDEASRYNIDNVSFVDKLHKHLTIKKTKKYVFDDDNLKNKIVSLMEDLSFFHKKYNLAYTFYSEMEKQKNYFLKTSSSNIISMDNNDFFMEHDRKFQKQLIRTKENVKNINNANDFIDFYRETENFIKRFVGITSSIADKYRLDKEDISHEDAIRTFLNDIFGYNDYIIEIIVMRVFDINKSGTIKRREIMSGLAEAYIKNYSVMHIINDTKHNESSRFSNYQLFITPESFLLKIIKNYFVIGVSATALNETRLHNFDIKFLKENSIVTKPSDEEMKKLEDLYLEHKVKNRDYKISSIEKSYKNKLTSKLQELCGENIDTEHWLEFYFNNDKNKKSTVVQFVEVFKYFCTTDVNAFLYLNSNDVMNKNDLKKTIYILIIEMIKKHYKTMPKRKKEYLNKFIDIDENGNIENNEKAIKKLENERSFIFHTNARDKQKKYKNELREHGVVFLASNYSFMATGQNIQYEFNGKKHDFDGIFLGSVTNIIASSLKPIKDDKQAVEQTILQTLYDINVLQQSGIISYKDSVLFLKDFLMLKKAVKIPHKKTSEYHNSIMHKIIQSVGRLHRTDTDVTLHLLFDDDMFNILAHYRYRSKATLPAIKTAVEEAKKNKKENSEKTADIETKISDSTHHSRRIINRLLRLFNTKERSLKGYKKAIEEYIGLKKQLLSNPTSDTFNSSHPEYINPHGNTIYYATDDDFETIEISLKPKNGFHAVLKETARIDILEKMPELYECFLENNIDTKWDKQYIMNPIMFNNLYKGELGETIGRFILEKYCGIELTEIDAQSSIRFEAFDFTNKDQTVFVDFKYFSTYTAKNTEIEHDSGFIENIRRKIDFANIPDAKIFIINIMVDEENEGEFKKEITIIDNKIYIIPWLIKSRDRTAILDNDMLINLTEKYNACNNK